MGALPQFGGDIRLGKLQSALKDGNSTKKRPQKFKKQPKIIRQNTNQITLWKEKSNEGRKLNIE